MNGSMRLIILALAFFVSSYQLASSADLIRGTIDAAKAECEAMDNGEFSTTEQTIQLADITGDGRPEEIVDAGQFACSTSASLYCGTGGCEISVFVDGKKHGFFGHGWKVVKWGELPILLIPLHGTSCGSYGATPCVGAYTWSDSSFYSLKTEK
jgi:hypothetical protein